MEKSAYSGLNVSVRIKETHLLTPSDYTAMLQATSLSDALNVLRKSEYHIPDHVEENKAFDRFLMHDLKETYQELYDSTPDTRVIDFYALRYAYHNLKVLFKEWYADKDFSEMYIPIGRYPIEALRSAVRTGDGEWLDQTMQQAIQDVRHEFDEYHSYDAISLILDTAYLNHLRELAKRIDDPGVTRVADMTIDFANLLMLVRAQQQKRSGSFMKAILSEAGTLDVDDLVAMALANNYAGIREAFSSLLYGGDLSLVLKDDGTTNVVQLEEAIQAIEAEEMRLAQLEAFGPMPVIAYLYFKENEITNIRLILVGKDNQLDQLAIEERMRSIYGA